MLHKGNYESLVVSLQEKNITAKVQQCEKKGAKTQTKAQ